jgi:hypothetical protein
MTNWEVVKETEGRVDLQCGPYGYEQVGVKIGERVIWLKVTSWPGHDNDGQYEEWVKIAHLIAAAPAMYEALRDAVNHCDECAGEGKIRYYPPGEKNWKVGECLVCKPWREALNLAEGRG